ncbi:MULTISPECIES: acyltransferase family protein [unclassified Facklamia]|uniref:acyltransferase family protein n=1 Tax=Aerococcaceae TaxID=186827 RepID=UPI0013B8536F|nr:MULTISPECIES: acyltransferase family protein [unclassified Facklamia]MBS4461007.1 acyltransferase [Aerococcaceae bacterium zg-B36]NEW64799.1 acyltransferase family protein [Facklamia sp. 252]NEW68121.1 acyltransferase family protein [Facklamia sp. 253]QQD64954.1 acyltransferase [Aerococcaceae bacterium zg-252]
MTQVLKRKLPYFNALDGLKGLAIIIILAYRYMEHLVPGGFLIVNLFLFIAGFLNFRYFHYRIRQNQPIDFKDYYRRCFERLFFPMLFMMMLSVVLILFFARGNFYNLRSMGFSSLLFSNNYYQILLKQSYFNQAVNQSPFAHLWFTSLYGQFILVTPLLVICCYQWHKNSSLAINMLLILSLVSMSFMAYMQWVGSPISQIYYDFCARISAYTLGGVLGFIIPLSIQPKELKQSTKWQLTLLGGGVFWLALMMILYMYGTRPFAYRFGLSLFSLLSVVMVFVAIYPGTIWHRLFSSKPLVWLGKRSYSYYLWLYPVSLILPRMIKVINRNYVIHIVASVLVTALLAELTYQLIEQKRISLPFGQDFNWQKTKFQLHYLNENKSGMLGVKWTMSCYAFVVIVGLLGMLFAPQLGSGETKTLAATFEQNTALAAKTRNGDVNNKLVINNIEGLEQQVKLYANALDVTFVGDSLLLASAKEILDVFPKAVLDVQEGRQLYASVETIEKLKQDNRLKPIVVTVVGLNGTFTQGQINDYIKAIGDEHLIYFVLMGTNLSWAKQLNEQLMQAAQRFGNVRIIDWSSLINSHPSWLLDDFHPNAVGSLELAKLIASELYRQR